MEERGLTCCRGGLGPQTQLLWGPLPTRLSPAPGWLEPPTVAGPGCADVADRFSSLLTIPNPSQARPCPSLIWGPWARTGDM